MPRLSYPIVKTAVHGSFDTDSIDDSSDNSINNSIDNLSDNSDDNLLKIVNKKKIGGKLPNIDNFELQDELNIVSINDNSAIELVNKVNAHINAYFNTKEITREMLLMKCGEIYKNEIVNRSIIAMKPEKSPVIPQRMNIFLEILENKMEENITKSYGKNFIYNQLRDSQLMPLDTYILASMNGPDDKEVKKKMEEVNTRDNQNKYRKKMRRKREENVKKINNYLFAAEKILSAKDYAKLWVKLDYGRNIFSADQIIKEGKLNINRVRSIIKDQLDYLNNVANNKCPHVKLLKKFRSAKSTYIANKYLEQLSTYWKKNRNFSLNFDDLKSLSFNELMKKVPIEHINCNNCGFRIMCTHLLIQHVGMMRRSTNYEILRELMRFSDTNNRNKSNDVFCGNCGEKLREQIHDGESSKSRVEIPEEMRKQIFSISGYVFNKLEINIKINTYKLMLMTAEAIYPFINKIQNDMIKSKMYSMDSVTERMSLFIPIYILAYVCVMIQSGFTTDIQFNLKLMPKRENSRVKKKIIDYINVALRLVTDMKNIVINKYPDFSDEFVKNTLLVAYKLMNDTKGGKKTSMDLQVVVAVRNVFDHVIYDPIYDYLYKYYTVFTSKAGKDRRNYAKDLKITEILNISIDELKKNKVKNHIYNNVGKTLGKKVPNVKLKELETKLDKIRGQKVVQWDTLNKYYTTIKIESIKFMIDYITSDFTSFNMNSVKGRFMEFLVRLVNLNKVEYKVNSIRYVNVLRPEFDYKIKNSRKINTKIYPIGYIYGENGMKHKWDSVIVSNSTSKSGTTIKESVIKKSELRGRHLRDEIKIIDEYSELTKTRKSEINNLSSKKVKSQVGLFDELKNIANFFVIICPEGGQHEWIDGATKNPTLFCKKCKMPQFMLSMGDSVYKDENKKNMMISYYKKYKEKWDKEKLILEKDSKSKFDKFLDEYQKKILQAEEKHKEKLRKEINNYSTDYKIVLKVASEFKININKLYNFGLIDDKNPSDVNGKRIEMDSAQYELRIHKFDAAIRMIAVEYNKLKYINRLGTTKIPKNIALIIQKSNLTKEKLIDISDKLPEIELVSYFTVLGLLKEAVCDKKAKESAKSKKEKVIGFQLTTMCNLVLKILGKESDKKSTLSQLRENFARYILEKVLYGDQMTTKYGKFNWALIYGDKIETKDEKDANFAMSSSSESGESDADELPKDAGLTNTPFENNFDVDVDTDGVDGDDDADDIGLEGYGLD